MKLVTFTFTIYQLTLLNTFHFYLFSFPSWYKAITQKFQYQKMVKQNLQYLYYHIKALWTRLRFLSIEQERNLISSSRDTFFFIRYPTVPTFHISHVPSISRSYRSKLPLDLDPSITDVDQVFTNLFSFTRHFSPTFFQCFRHLRPSTFFCLFLSYSFSSFSRKTVRRLVFPPEGQSSIPARPVILLLHVCTIIFVVIVVIIIVIAN